MIELDHIFICVSEGAPEGDALVEWGWGEGTPNVHEELGTANRRFYAHNFMLELLYRRNPTVLAGDVTFALEERFAGASPFGVCLRCEAPDEPLPFDALPMEFGFLPGHVSARISGESGNPKTPAVFCLSGIARPELYPAERRPPLDHPAGIQYLTRARLTAPAPGPGRSLALVAGAGHIEVATGPEPLLELWFDGGERPHGFTGHGLPLVVYCR
jgi:hypothetical protein